MRTARVLDAADDLRRGSQEVIAVAAEQHGPQVVGALHRPAFAVELGGDVRVLLHQFAHAVGLGHELSVGVVRAEVRPRVVAALRLLVLELNVVEVVLMAVEAVDGHRDVPAALAVHLGIGVQHPLVARCGDGQAACLAQEVDVERGQCPCVLRVGGRHHADDQTLVVEALSGAYLHLQGRLRAGNARHGHAAGGQRLSVDADLRALRVQLVGNEHLQDGDAVGGLRLLAVVAHIDGELGSVVDGHAAHALLVQTNLRVHNLQCAGVEHRARVIDLRHALVFPRVLGGAATGAEHETARTQDVLFLERLANIVLHVVVQGVEVVVREDVLGTHELLFLVYLRLHAVNVDVQVACRVGGNGETLRAVVCPRFSIGAHRGAYNHGQNLPLEKMTRERDTLVRSVILGYDYRRV